jgi:eukaryotic-like serine/threonine-protein kinase
MLTLFKRLFQRSSSGDRPGQAHITFGKTSIGRTVSRTRLLLKKQLWIWPIIAILLLAGVGYGIRSAIERTMKENLQSQLETTLNIERSMLETWLKVQESNAESLANGQHVREIAAEILSASQPVLGAPAAASEATSSEASSRPRLTEQHTRLGQELGPGLSAHGFISYFLADKENRVLSSSNPELVGQIIQEHEGFVGHALEG